MKKIALSLLTIAAVATLTVSATRAYFTDTAKITHNTFSTGQLDITVNGHDTIAGETFGPMAPDEMRFGGPYRIANPDVTGNVDVKSLKLSALQDATASALGVGEDSALWDQVKIKIFVHKSLLGSTPDSSEWSIWPVAFDGNIKDLINTDILGPTSMGNMDRGDSMWLVYKIWLPDNNLDQGSLMNKTVSWDFVLEGRSS